MSKIPVIGIRYCGGCNPRYDRVAAVNKLKSLLPEMAFEAVQPDHDYDSVVVVCGCDAACAKTDDLKVPSRKLLRIGEWKDIMSTRDRLHQIAVPKETTALDHDQVMQILPHRPPMLLIDTVSELIPGEEIRAQFTAVKDMYVFKGHFPDYPVLPGVLTVEALAQAADIMLMSQDKYAGKLPVLAGVDKVRLRLPVRPGDTLTLCASLIDEREIYGLAVCKGQVLIDGKLAADCEITLIMK